MAERAGLEPRGTLGCRVVVLVVLDRGQERPHGHQQRRQRSSADDEEVHGQGYGEAGGEHADAGTADGAEAPGGVEPWHHGATETALDLGALDVHGDVPDRRTEAVAAQAGGDDGLDLEAGDAEGDDAHAERHQHATAATHSRSPEPLDHPAARGQPEQRTDRDRQQQQAELAVGEVEPLAQVGHPREQGGEDQPVEDERGRHGVACAQVRTGGCRGHRCCAALGGDASSQAWKPISASWLSASSRSPSLVVQRMTTWSGYSESCSTRPGHAGRRRPGRIASQTYLGRGFSEKIRNHSSEAAV